MKSGIHPEYKEAVITCACGETVHTRSTVESLRIEICSKCHPFFTGKQKLVDTAGRVERFEKKYSDVAEDLERQKEEERLARIEAAKAKAEQQMADREEKKKRLAERQRRKQERAAEIEAAKEEVVAAAPAGAEAKAEEPAAPEAMPATEETPAPEEAPAASEEAASPEEA